MKILIGYERFGNVRRAFRELGHDAWSCDIEPAEDGSPHHLQCDIWDVANHHWDMGIFYPVCTYLTVAAAWALADPDFDLYPGVGYHQKVKPGTLVGADRREAHAAAVANFRRLMDLPYRKAIENPSPSMVSKYVGKATQIIQPNQFGEDASKGTGLWLDRLPPLVPTKRIQGRIVNGVERWANQTDSGQNRLSPSESRAALRGETYPGIAKAKAEQWGDR